MFGSEIVIWEVLDDIFVDFRGSSKCFKVFFVNVKEVQRERDGFSCEVQK
jgi:hypothetical protein